MHNCEKVEDNCKSKFFRTKSVETMQISQTIQN